MKTRGLLFASMVVSKSSHSSFSIGNKIFVIDIEYESCCEVYDSISRKHSVLNLFIPRKGYKYDNIMALNIGKKMFIFYSLDTDYHKLRLHVYNLDEFEIIDEDIVINKNFVYPAVQKYPKS